MPYPAAIVALTIALCYPPGKDDFARFGLPLTPAWNGDGCVSPVRAAWRATTQLRQGRCACPRCPVDVKEDAIWRERCWYFLDDLADSNRPPGVRDDAAVQLKSLLGPVAYFRGTLPTPWPEE